MGTYGLFITDAQKQYGNLCFIIYRQIIRQHILRSTYPLTSSSGEVLLSTEGHR